MNQTVSSILNDPGKNLTLFLIGEELKSRRFFHTLLQLGLDDSYYQPHLDEAILAFTGLTDESDATLDFYYAVMEEHARKIGTDKQSVGREALGAYTRLTGRETPAG
jgi:hypothetical protein